MGASRKALTALAVLAGLATCGPTLADPAAWLVEGHGGGELRLLGSMHELRSSDYPLPTSIDELYARADTLVMELDLDDLDSVAEQATFLAAATLPEGKVLGDVVAAPLYARTDRAARRLGVDIAQLERFEPWMVAVSLLELGTRRVGFEAQRGVEQYLLGKARRDHKQILGLETVEFQVGLFDHLSAHDQQALLEQTVNELDSAGATLDSLARAWRQGELDAAAKELLGEFDGFPELYATLVKQRNARWVPVLERLLENGHRYLVVVGALHLVGDDSVIALLRRRGHTVTRLPKG